MMKNPTGQINLLLLILPFLAVTLGCGEQTPKKNSNTKVKYDPSAFLAKAEIAGARDVKDVRKEAKDNDKIVIVGRIGGSLDPWVEGRAAFSIVDRSIKACSDDTPEGEACSCKTPWDYCCETDQLKDGMVLVKFVENDGKIIKHDAREIFSLKELQTVVIEGKAQRDQSGNLTVLASRMFAHQ